MAETSKPLNRMAPTTFDTSGTTEEKLKKGWRYVAIPSQNPIFSRERFPTIRFNSIGLEPGKKYLLPPDLAKSAEDRIEAYNKSQVRILQPDQDARALADRDSYEAARTKTFDPLGEQFAVA